MLTAASPQSSASLALHLRTLDKDFTVFCNFGAVTVSSANSRNVRAEKALLVFSAAGLLLPVHRPSRMSAFPVDPG